jgi:hypothetical protein
MRDAVPLGETTLSCGIGMSIPPSGITVFDKPAAGTYTYKLQATRSGGTIISLAHVKLIAFEL